MRRAKISQRRSKKVFHKTAKHSHRRNSSAGPMRGGIRF